jgi:hypothetical protein
MPFFGLLPKFSASSRALHIPIDLYLPALSSGSPLRHAPQRANIVLTKPHETSHLYLIARSSSLQSITLSAERVPDWCVGGAHRCSETRVAQNSLGALFKCHFTSSSVHAF